VSGLNGQGNKTINQKGPLDGVKCSKQTINVNTLAELTSP